MKVFILFVFIFSFVSSAQSSQKVILNNLFDQLQIIDNSKSAALLEQKIWSVWNEHPNDFKLTEKLEFGTELMQYGDYNYALKVFSNILENDPKWSEAWNKRATVYFLMSQFKNSLNDIDKVLKLLNAKNIIVGHTTQEKIVSLFNNKIFGVDSGIKYGLDGEILIVKNKKFFRGDLNGKLTEF